jgi:hypothetical protein
LLILGLAYWLISKKPWRTSQKPNDAFAISDTAKVTKIFMANKEGEKILLERTTENKWKVNGNFLADEPKIKLLLATLHDMQIQMPVPESMHNTVIGILATRGVKTEVYAGDELLKTIYVGSETLDKTGTFMMLEGDKETYSVHIPGFVGFLTPRFFLTEIKWRSKLVFDVNPDQISEIQISYPLNEKESFTYTDELFKKQQSILSYDGLLVQADTQQVKMLIYSFTQKYVEGYYEDITFTKKERDSLFQLTPYCRIRLKQKSGVEQNIALYQKPIGDRTKERYDEQGKELSIDPEKFYAKLDQIDQMASIQEYAFRRILVKASSLTKHF